MSSNPVSPPPIPAGSPPPDEQVQTLAGGVRRHHTITATSRGTRTSRLLSEDSQNQTTWNDDEVVDPDWVGGVGAVGEKSGALHRQSSLPTRYNRTSVLRNTNRQGGTLTPRTMNTLTSITAENVHEGEDEDWENDMRSWNSDERVDGHDMSQYSHVVESHSGSSHGHSPLSPSFPPHTVSPPPAEVNVRRNQSLTYGAAGGNVRRMAVNLRRSGTLQAQIERPHASTAASSTSPPSPVDNEEDFQENEQQQYPEEDYQYSLRQQQQNTYAQSTGHYTPSSVGRSSPWSMNSAGSEWRSNAAVGSGSNAIDDVQRALSGLEIGSNNGSQGMLPPRYTNQQGGGAVSQHSNLRGNSNNGNGNGLGVSQLGAGGGKLQLVTDIDNNLRSGPNSASTNVSTMGHGAFPQQDRHRGSSMSGWDQQHQEKIRSLTSRSSNPNLQYSAGGYDASGLPPNPPIPAQYLGQQGQAQSPRLGVSTNFGQGQPGYITSPIDVPSLIATKGYNPAAFNCKPDFARFFVIKSYTEDDVHKSLKYEIWSSTDPGNKRLDKAFKETAGRGPIYLFFSVNASGHFCGMAEMMTAVDYTRSSTVWASDKWKGVFKVRWIFVRDIPNSTLRHIKLNNTQERKPVTNSRDTQELLPDAGQEMLRIFFTHPARTSLLQDFAFYELQSMQKIQQQQQQSAAPQSPPLQSTSPQPGQHPFALPNPYSGQLNSITQLGQMGQMIPPLQMSSQYAVQSNIMRNPSPVPVNPGPQSYMGNF